MSRLKRIARGSADSSQTFVTPGLCMPRRSSGQGVPEEVAPVDARSMAVASSAWHIRGSTQARLAFTAKPAGRIPPSDGVVVVVTHALASAASMNENVRAPMPWWRPVDRLPAAACDPQRRVGPLTNLGTRLPAACGQIAVVAGEGFFDEQAGHDVERFVATGPVWWPGRHRSRRAQPRSSIPPYRTHPPSDTRSSVAIRSAIRAG